MNSIVAGIDLGDSESLATVLSPLRDVVKKFSFKMNGEELALLSLHYSSFASTDRHPTDHFLVGLEDLTIFGKRKTFQKCPLLILNVITGCFCETLNISLYECKLTGPKMGFPTRA